MSSRTAFPWGLPGCLAFLIVVAMLVFKGHATASAANITWIGGNADWVDGASNNANWNPADEPDADDTAIFNTANAVNLGSNNAIVALTMSAGIDLFTNDFDFDVNGLVQLTGSSTNLTIDGGDSLLTADSVTINNLANLEVDGGTLQISEETGNGLVDVNAGGELVGHGTVNMTDAVAANTSLIVNDGAITARRDPLILFGAPPVGTLSLNATDADARIDLDGGSEMGVVNVTRNQTLDVNIPLADTFSGTMNLFQNATLDISSAWTLNTGTINANNGFIDGVFPNPDVPAGVSIIDGGALTQTGGTINVIDSDGTLRFNTGFVMSDGTFTNNGLVIFDGDALIDAGANFNMAGAGASFTVEANRDVTINQTDFNLDGTTVNATNITINAGGLLTVNVSDYDPDSGSNSFDGIVTLNSGAISVTTGDAEFVMEGTLNMNASAGQGAEWSGDAIDIGNDTGALDADLNVTGDGNPNSQGRFFAQVDFNSDADVNVAAGASLVLNSVVNFDTVNGVNNAEFTGTGSMLFSNVVNVNEAVTLNMVGGTVDLDANDATGEFINVDAPLTINAGTMSNFGRVNGGGGINTLDVNNSVGTGVLTVNLDDPNAEWTLNGPGVMNLVNDNTEATLLAGSDVNVNGTVNVTGDVRTTARLDVAGVVNINTAAQPLRLAGGNNTDDPNTISGGTISGVGLLGADIGKALQGFGAINTGIDFDGSSNLRADNGTLTINGAIVDAGQVGTADVDGTFHVTNAWNNNVTTGVQLRGGTLSGGAMTNDVVAGISGHGLVTARVINNTQFFGSIGEALIFETPGNDNDWDGTTNAGAISAVNANIELRDNATFGFTGNVSATNGHRVFANGFALDFNPGSIFGLASGGVYQSTHSTDIGGTVTIGTGADSTIEVANNAFLTFETGSSTTLNGNLRLVNNNINIEAGATFSGAGALIVPDGSHMVADNLANVGVLLDMQGAFRPGNSEGLGRIDLFDYQQSGTGDLFVELTGTGLNQFDRLVASGDVVVGGYLNIDIDGAFVPAIGNTFNIITGNTVTGAFSFADVSGMPDGLSFHINYLANAVQLQVVNTPFFSADFDDDGDVDQTDLTPIWKGAFGLNQLGDADGDNDSDGADFLIWQRQFGSVPAVAVATPATGAVPEPSVAALLLAVAFAACRQSRW